MSALRPRISKKDLKEKEQDAVLKRLIEECGLYQGMYLNKPLEGDLICKSDNIKKHYCRICDVTYGFEEFSALAKHCTSQTHRLKCVINTKLNKINNLKAQLKAQVAANKQLQGTVSHYKDVIASLSVNKQETLVCKKASSEIQTARGVEIFSINTVDSLIKNFETTYKSLSYCSKRNYLTIIRNFRQRNPEFNTFEFFMLAKEFIYEAKTVQTANLRSVALSYIGKHIHADMS